MPRRRAGVLLPLELEILDAGLAFPMEGPGFHGFALASALGGGRSTSLIGHGTLYKALGRLEKGGLLSSTWEDAAIAEREGRPRRKLYRVTPDGAVALAAARADASADPASTAARTASRPATR